MIIKKCLKCGAIIKVLEDCHCNNCEIMCCDEKMVIEEPNSKDASFEKHVPNYEINDNKIKVWVNHVMEEEHYIMWISITNGIFEYTKYLKPGDKPEVEFPMISNAKIYAYCNLHGLWVNKID